MRGWGSEDNPICGSVTWYSSIRSLQHCPRLNPVSLTLPSWGPDGGGRNSLQGLPAPAGEREGQKARGTAGWAPGALG